MAGKQKKIVLTDTKPGVIESVLIDTPKTEILNDSIDKSVITDNQPIDENLITESANTIEEPKIAELIEENESIPTISESELNQLIENINVAELIEESRIEEPVAIQPPARVYGSRQDGGIHF